MSAAMLKHGMLAQARRLLEVLTSAARDDGSVWHTSIDLPGRGERICQDDPRVGTEGQNHPYRHSVSRPVLADHKHVVSAVITDIDDDQGQVVLDLTIENVQDETRVFGTATVSIPKSAN